MKQYPNLLNQLITARSLAKLHHKNQTDKAGRPYFEHVERVSSGCDTIESQIVGYLHDLVEDTDITLDQLKQMFSPEIVEAVGLLSKNVDLDWCCDAEAKEFVYYDRIKSNELARKVKLSDLKDNSNIGRIPYPSPKDYRRTAKYFNHIADLMEE